MQNELKEKVLDLVGQYSQELASKGLICDISQKYSQHRVSPQSINHHRDGLLIDICEIIFHRIRRAQEKEKYKNQPDRYYTLVLSFVPSNKSSVKKIDCKEYSFLCKKITRYEAGYTPKVKEYQLSKILKKIEKRITKTLKKADKMSADKVCKNTLLDNLRYLHHEKYHYKKTVFGKDRQIVELIIGLIALVVFIFLAIMIYIAL